MIDQASTRLNIPLQSLLMNDLGVPLTLHISLSRSLSVPQTTRQALSSAIENAVYWADVKPFQLELGGFIWASNHTNTRSFFAAAIKKPPVDELNRLLKAVNAAVVSLGFGPLYTAQSEGDLMSQSQLDYTRFFHFSLAWCLRDEDDEDESDTANESRTEALDNIWASADQGLKAITVPVSTVLIKIGDKVTALDVKPSEEKIRAKDRGLW